MVKIFLQFFYKNFTTVTFDLSQIASREQKNLSYLNPKEKSISYTSATATENILLCRVATFLKLF